MGEPSIKNEMLRVRRRMLFIVLECGRLVCPDTSSSGHGTDRFETPLCDGSNVKPRLILGADI